VIEWPHHRQNAETLRRRLLEACNRRGVPVVFRREVKTTDGTPAWGLASEEGIVLEYQDDVISEVATLVHELSHCCLHVGVDDVSRRQEEFEANTVASILLEAYQCGAPTPWNRITPRVAEAANFLIGEVEHEKACDVADVLTNLNAALEVL
jgi:hypothetical protein